MSNMERNSAESKAAELKQAALEYHEFPTPGKLAVTPTTPPPSSVASGMRCKRRLESHVREPA